MKKNISATKIQKNQIIIFEKTENGQKWRLSWGAEGAKRGETGEKRGWVDK